MLCINASSLYCFNSATALVLMFGVSVIDQAQKVPRCKLHLGDRPIHITLQRAFALLSCWQLVKFIWHAWNFDEPIRYDFKEVVLAGPVAYCKLNMKTYA